MRDMKQVFIKKQKEKFERGGINRRQFITSMLAAGVVLPTAMTMASEVQAADPKKGGKLRHGTGYGATTDVIDPTVSYN